MSSDQQPPSGHRFLWVLRHAKAVADPPAGGADYDRPLTGRGRHDAVDLGTRLAAGDGVFGLDGVALPQVILSSSAARTYQTAELVLENMGVPVRSTPTGRSTPPIPTRSSRSCGRSTSR